MKKIDIDIESLGFTKDELQQRVVDQICGQILSSVGYDEEGNEASTQSRFSRSVEKKCKEQIDATIDRLAQQYIFPNVSQYIETLCLQETTTWGEKRGEPVTFIQYLVKRAEHYLQEPVDRNGKNKGESGDYSWSAGQSRITHLVHEHLRFSIESAMRDALNIANKSIATGIAETVKIKLSEITQGIQIAVKTKS